MKLINGSVYKDNLSTFTLVYFYHNDSYGMLHLCTHTIEGMSAPCFQSDKNGEFQFTHDELIKDWGAESWTLLDYRLDYKSNKR